MMTEYTHFINLYRDIIMKKLTTLFTTTMIALALMMAAPSAMAGKKVPDADSSAGYTANYWCAVSGNIGFKNHGQCVKQWIIWLKG